MIKLYSGTIFIVGGLFIGSEMCQYLSLVNNLSVNLHEDHSEITLQREASFQKIINSSTNCG